MSPVDLDERLRRALRANAPGAAHAPEYLRVALAEALSRTGRLARATLLLAAAESAGMPESAAEKLACAIEYWQLASLLFDDLPCMDNADERRGRRCLHRTHGEPATILTALALINRAYTLVGEAFLPQPADTRAAALRLVEAVMGPDGIVGGQAADLSFAASAQAPAVVSRIAWQKTGSLLWLCVALPALWGGPDLARQRSLRRLGIYWGIAYQAIDDLGDVLSTAVELGKPARRDAALARPNLALALGVPAARRRVTRLLGQARGTIERLVAGDPRQIFLLRWHEARFAARELALRAA